MLMGGGEGLAELGEAWVGNTWRMSFERRAEVGWQSA